MFRPCKIIIFTIPINYYYNLYTLCCIKEDVVKVNCVYDSSNRNMITTVSYYVMDIYYRDHVEIFIIGRYYYILILLSTQSIIILASSKGRGSHDTHSI